MPGQPTAVPYSEGKGKAVVSMWEMREDMGVLTAAVNADNGEQRLCDTTQALTGKHASLCIDALDSRFTRRGDKGHIPKRQTCTFHSRQGCGSPRSS